MAEKTSAIRVWSNVANAPDKIGAAAPDGYAQGVAAVYGGTVDGLAPQAWADGLQETLGLTEAAHATVVLVNVPAFLWTAYWLPGGTVGG